MVPIVHEQDSSLSQVFHSLGVLESVVLDVFTNVVARTGAEKEKLLSLNARVKVMGHQIAQVAANKQMATCVTSPAKFPAAAEQVPLMFTPATRQQIQDHLPVPESFPKTYLSSSVLPTTQGVSELFLSLDHSRQSLQTHVASVTHLDQGLSSVSSLVPFGSKHLSEPIMQPKKPLELGPQPQVSAILAREKGSLLFPRSHAAPPSLGVPSDLPLPKLAQLQLDDMKMLPTFATFTPVVSASSSSELATPCSLSVVSSAVAFHVVSQPFAVEPVHLAAPEELHNIPDAPRFDLVIEAKLSPVELKVEQTVTTAFQSIPPSVSQSTFAPATGGRGDLLRDIEKQAQERERRRAEQQVNLVTVRVNPDPIPLPLLNPTQDDALRRALEDRRRDVEEDDVWEPADDF